MTTSSVRTEVLLPTNGVSLARTSHSSAVSLIVMSTRPPTRATKKPGHTSRKTCTPVTVQRLCRSDLLTGLALHRGLHQPGEERVRAGRAGAQLGVRLGRDEIRVDLAGVLD